MITKNPSMPKMVPVKNKMTIIKRAPSLATNQYRGLSVLPDIKPS